MNGIPETLHQFITKFEPVLPKVNIQTFRQMYYQQNCILFLKSGNYILIREDEDEDSLLHLDFFRKVPGTSKTTK